MNFLMYINYYRLNLQKLNNEQKLKELSKIFLSANDSKYTELSPKEKAKYEKDTVEILKN